MSGPRDGPRRAFRLPSSRARLWAELDDEIRFHLEGRVEDIMAREGLSRADAQAEAARRFGDLEAYRRETRAIDRDMNRRRHLVEILSSIRREVGLAFRSLRRAKVFSMVTFVTMMLGIGATTAIYTVLDSVVLRPLPYRDPQELVAVLHPTTVPGIGESKWGMSAGGYFEFQKLNRSFSALGGFATGAGVLPGDNGDTQVLRVARITASIFTVLEAQAYAGRLLSADDDRPGVPLHAVLSYEFWQRRFGGDRGLVGGTIRLAGGRQVQVVGIAEPGLSLPMPGPFATTANLAGFGVDLWVPLQLNPAGPFYNSHQYTGIARLKPGVTPEDAQRDLAAITRRFPELVPNAYSPNFMQQYNFRVGVTSLKAEVLGPTVARSLWILFGAVSLVLLIACANVANLFLVRMETRRRESAIRSALGARRGDMAIHYLVESLLLTTTAGVAAIGVARWGIPLMLAVAPSNIPRLSSATLGGSAVLFGLTLAVLAGLVFGVIPMFRRGIDVDTLKEGGRGLTHSRRQRRARTVLVVGQVSLAVVLMSAAGLLVQSFRRLLDVRPGLDPHGVLTFEVGLPYLTYGTTESAAAFHHALSDRLASLPGVTAVGASTGLPLQDYGQGCTVVFREGRPYVDNEETPCVHTLRFTPGFFRALGIAVNGRRPGWRDVDGRTQAAVVTQALADRLWPGEDPIGKGIGSNGPGATDWYRVVGVIPELRAAGLDQPPTEAVFYPATSLRTGNDRGQLNEMSYTLRTTLPDPTSLVPQIRRLVSAMNKEVPVVNPRLMTEIEARSMATTSFIMLLLVLAGGMALLLSAVGIYGVISYLVSQQRADIGVRMALGAQRAQVRRRVVVQSVSLALAGAAIGTVAAIAGTRLLRALLFGVSPTDPLVLTLAPVLLLCIAALASLAPAARASRIDPVEAMRV